MIVKVTNKHIKMGEACNCQECPVALALYDVSGESYIVARTEYIQVGHFAKYKVPRSVSRFMQRFDDGRKVKPFNFKLVPL